jgi:hypothetical protein
MFDRKRLRRASISPNWCYLALCLMVGIALGAEASISDQPAASSNGDPCRSDAFLPPSVQVASLDASSPIQRF